MLVAGGTGAAPSWYRGAYGSLAAHHKILALSSPASSVPFCFSPCQKAWKKKKKKKRESEISPHLQSILYKEVFKPYR